MIVCISGAEYGFGKIFAEEFTKRGHEVVSMTGVYFSDRADIASFLRNHHPRAVIHCRTDFPSPVLAMTNLGLVCMERQIPIMLPSSTSVFGNIPKASERTPREPITSLGKMYYECENIAAQTGRFYILRCPDNRFGCKDKNDIAEKLLELGSKKKEIILNSTAKFSVVSCYDAAELGADIVEKGKFGIYNCANEGLCTEFSLACEVYRLARLAGMDEFYDVAVLPTDTGGIPFELVCNSIKKVGIVPLESWQSGLSGYIGNLSPKIQLGKRDSVKMTTQ